MVAYVVSRWPSNVGGASAGIMYVRVPPRFGVSAARQDSESAVARPAIQNAELIFTVFSSVFLLRQRASLAQPLERFPGTRARSRNSARREYKQHDVAVALRETPGPTTCIHRLRSDSADEIRIRREDA